MNPSAFDFAPRTPTWHLLRVRPWEWAALAVLAAMVGLGLSRWSAWQSSAAASGEMLRLLAEQQRSAQRAAPATLPLNPSQVAQVNAAVRQLNLPWTELLDALQQARGPRVALLEVTPDAGGPRLRMTAEVADPQEMVGFVERLKRQEIIAGVELLHHEVNEQNARKPLGFGLQVRWRE